MAKRPEQDVSAVSLPGEPLDPESPAERLEEAAPVDVGSLGTGTGIASVSIPLPPAAVESGESSGD